MPDTETTDTAETEVTETEETTTAATTTTTDDDAFDKDRAMHTIRTLREAEKEGKRAARERDDLAARLKALEDEKLTDQQKIEKERDELKADQARWAEERKDTALRLAVFEKKDDLGIADASLALAALKTDYADRVVYAADGKPENLDDILTELLEAKPLLNVQATKPASATINAGDGGTAKTPPALTAEELASLGGMTPEEYAAFKGVTTIDDYNKLRASEKPAAAA